LGLKYKTVQSRYRWLGWSMIERSIYRASRPSYNPRMYCQMIHLQDSGVHSTYRHRLKSDPKSKPVWTFQVPPLTEPRMRSDLIFDIFHDGRFLAYRVTMTPPHMAARSPRCEWTSHVHKVKSSPQQMVVNGLEIGWQALALERPTVCAHHLLECVGIVYLNSGIQ